MRILKAQIPAEVLDSAGVDLIDIIIHAGQHQRLNVLKYSFSDDTLTTNPFPENEEGKKTIDNLRKAVGDKLTLLDVTDQHLTGTTDAPGGYDAPGTLTLVYTSATTRFIAVQKGRVDEQRSRYAYGNYAFSVQQYRSQP